MPDKREPARTARRTYADPAKEFFVASAIVLMLIVAMLLGSEL